MANVNPRAGSDVPPAAAASRHNFARDPERGACRRVRDRERVPRTLFPRADLVERIGMTIPRMTIPR
jgi:hypothetical protein